MHIQSGTEFGITLGTPIGLRIANEDQRPHDYSDMDRYPRPSHADWTYLLKYGVKASSGGGRSSARETIGRVAAAGVAEKYLSLVHDVEIVAFVTSVGNVHLPCSRGPSLAAEFARLQATLTRQQLDTMSPRVRCPDAEISQKMEEVIASYRDAKDSIGGTVTCVIRNPPRGLGEPCFDKLEAKLAHAMLSIPATKGFEVGSGFQGTEIPGSKHNDAFVSSSNGRLATVTNNSGGIQGGISNGEPIYFKVAFKSPATIGQAQNTATYDGTDGTLAAKGRHDPCVVPRAVPIVEAMAALVIMDAILIQQSREATRAGIQGALKVPVETGIGKEGDGEVFGDE